MTPELVERLLTSLQDENLIFISGAGLSIPSGVPLAQDLASKCCDKHIDSGGELPAELNNQDLEAVARYFDEQNLLRRHFIPKLVPWEDFTVAEPNNGHFAIADFLCCDATPSSITTNYDSCIEKAAHYLGVERFYACLEGDCMALVQEHGSLLKIHGCAVREREMTLWIPEQLDSDYFQTRRDSIRIWLTANLNMKDIVFVGFWTDWDYLIEIFNLCIPNIELQNVYIINPSSEEELREKCPELWNLLTDASHDFFHEKESAVDWLDELRVIFSHRFLKKVLLNSIEEAKSIGIEVNAEEVNLTLNCDSESLYRLRRDICGCTRNEAVRDKEPSNSMVPVGALILYFKNNDINWDGQYWRYGEKRIRVIQGAGRAMSVVKSIFANEPPDIVSPDYVVCAGATDDGGVPSNIVRGDNEKTYFRSGIQGEWILRDKIIEIIGGEVS